MEFLNFYINIFIIYMIDKLIQCKDGLNNVTKYIKNSELTKNKQILIYINDSKIPFLFYRSNLINLLFDEIYYFCQDKDNKLEINSSIE